MVATSAIATRELAEFTSRVKDVLGVAPSGHRQPTSRRRPALSFIRGDQGTGRPRGPGAVPPYWLTDIGGGSTEFVLRRRQVVAAKNKNKKTKLLF